MNYEIHITLEVSNVGKFIDDCKIIGVKPIIIETQNSKDEKKLQIMTSSNYTGGNYKETLENLVVEITKLNYNIIRKKIEIKPEKVEHSEHIYYETHFRLKLPINFDYTDLRSKCNELNFHLSKNLFKKDDVNIWQMITYRSYEQSYFEFIDVISKMRIELSALDIEHDKIEIEECIYDTKCSIDDNWLNIEDFLLKVPDIYDARSSLLSFLNKEEQANLNYSSLEELYNHIEKCQKRYSKIKEKYRYK